MAELSGNKGGGCGERLVGLLLLVPVIIPLFYFDSLLSEKAASICPEGTFSSGRTHDWNGWAVTILGVAIWFLLIQAITRLWVREYEGNEIFRPFGKVGIIFLAAFFITGLGVYWIASSSELCLAKDGIYHRSLPWRDFQRHAWSNVSEIAVDCRDRRRSPDLYYTVKFKDGAELDIADAMPSWEPSRQFRSHLAGIPFRFTADVAHSCPMPYVDWVGQRP